MKTKLFPVITTIALMALCFTSCVPDQEIAGIRWNASWSGADNDGDLCTTTVDLVLNTENTGMLFINQEYDGEGMGGGFAIPVTYTWDDNHGTATGTYEYESDDNGNHTHTATIDLDYTKTEGFRISARGELSNWYGLTLLALTQKDYVKNPVLEGTRWVCEYEEDGTTYHYEISFVSTSAALITLQYSDGNGEEESERWNMDYSLNSGLATTTIRFFGETVTGGFFLSDATHLTFCDSENFLKFIKE